MHQAVIYTDGGSRGNPGPAAGAYVLQDENGRQIYAAAKFISNATNNVAEYTGLIEGLKKAVELGIEKIKILSDSELLVKQILGLYKVKNDGLKPLHQSCVKLLEKFKDAQISHIVRAKNKTADLLANRAMDAKRDITARPQTSNGQRLKLAVLLSGGGRTMANLLEKIESGYLNAQIVLVISSRSDVAGVDKARAAKLPLEIVRRKDYSDTEQFSEKLKKLILAAKADLVVQAGWLCLWKIPAELENKVMNIHPALLPSFGGKGMWGHNVHEAVLKAGCKMSGCTVHFCTNEYDKGAIIVQRSCPVEENDTADSLASRVFDEECIAYPEAIRLFAENKIIVKDGKTVISD